MLKCLHFICNLGSRRLWVWQGRGAGSGRRTSPGKEEPSLGRLPASPSTWRLMDLVGLYLEGVSPAP